MKYDRVSNERLLEIYNSKPDFQNDDELYQIVKRVKAKTLTVEMQDNTLVIIQKHY